MTAYAALLMVAFTIMATATSHRFWQFSDPALYRAQSTNFWKNVSMMGGMILLFVTAGGHYSLDQLFRGRVREAAPQPTFGERYSANVGPEDDNRIEPLDLSRA